VHDKRRIHKHLVVCFWSEFLVAFHIGDLHLEFARAFALSHFDDVTRKTNT